jgi:hypothetical protein
MCRTSRCLLFWAACAPADPAANGPHAPWIRLGARGPPEGAALSESFFVADFYPVTERFEKLT